MLASDTHPILWVCHAAAAQFERVFSIAELTETVEGGTNRVKGIATPQRFGNHVMDAGDLYHRSDRTTGDDSSSLLCGLEKDMLGPEQPVNLMRNRPGRESDVHQVFLGLFDRLRNRDRHFGSLPFPDTDPPLSISHDNQCAEIEPFSTLYDFGHSVDKNNLVLQA